MPSRILSLAALCLLLCSCNIQHPGPNANEQSPLCLRITQKLDRGSVTNNTPSSRTVTTADKAHLLKQYNQLGCHRSADNRYAYPKDSLHINDQANQIQPHEIKHKK